MEIKDLYGTVLYSTEVTTVREALIEAIVKGIQLVRADLSGVDLYGANLSGANLSGANLSRVDLSGANLSGANLSRVDLYGADLSGANLSGANLKDTKRLNWLVCPEVGSFTAFKKVRDAYGCGAVLRIRVDAETARINGIGSRKCRAERVFVIAVESVTTAEFFVPYTQPDQDEACQYRVGEYTVSHEFNDDPRQECTGGIHFFMTKKEAEEWS